MDEADRDDLEDLLQAHKRRLRRLQKQAAHFGAQTDPHILNEIEDIQDKILQIEGKLGAKEAASKDTDIAHEGRSNLQIQDVNDEDRIVGEEKHQEKVASSYIGVGGRMWLVYLRFDDHGQVKTCHIRTGNKSDVNYLLSLAEKHGLSKTAKLVEYAAFIASGTIKLKPMIVPNFHFYLHEDFVKRWQEVDGQVAPKP